MINKLFSLLRRKASTAPELSGDYNITVKIHYKRPDEDYTQWNAWIWALNLGGKGYPLVEEKGEMVATLTVDGRYTTSISFILRKGQWQEQEFGERKIDVATITSGTIHYYATSGQLEGKVVLDSDIRRGNKVISAQLDYDTGFVHIRTSAPITGDLKKALRIKDITGRDGAISAMSITPGAEGYALMPNKPLSLTTLHRYAIRLEGVDNPIKNTTVYASRRFNQEFTYEGDDLGAVWTPKYTTFKVWAPTAEDVKLALYRTGTEGMNDRVATVEMKLGEQGVWSARVPGNLHGTYYTYLVKVEGVVNEAVDPYARSGGVNGKRGMVLDMNAVNPQGWDQDKNPNPIPHYTDAVVYELHVRDATIDPDSGVDEKYRGKFLGLAQSGTRSPSGQPTGLDYIKSLGITHLQLLPIYDYGSVDEAHPEIPQFNWGYDPVNYNMPEGSYSTDASNGAARVRELKYLIKTLHDNGISVIMDVVYNHVFEAGTYCFNRIVPGYFSRSNPDGSPSNGSGCGNDTASERPMIRKFIVESVAYWNKEYHIDGFRFDLVGLLDTTTINELVDTVHDHQPDAIFYGEGWTLNTAVEPGNHMATQPNAHRTPEFGYFNDNIRNLLAGENGHSLGFVSGLTGKEDPLFHCFTGDVWWCPQPTQTVNYVSCHDNYTLMDKLCLSRKDATRADLVRMNKLAAAIYMTAQGVPFIHAGEEYFREKLTESGRRVENSYNSSDFVNKIRWSWLDDRDRADTVAYYKGLIALRKRFANLRLATKAEVAKQVCYRWITNELVLFDISGQENLLVIFNATTKALPLDLYEHDVIAGEWKVLVNDEKAGITPIETVSDGKLTLPPICAMVLVRE